MQKVKKVLLILSLMTLLIGGGVGSYIWWQQYKTEKIIQAHISTKALVEASLAIEKVWREGTDQEFQCEQKNLGNYKRVNENYLRCNPDFLNCWLRQVFPRSFQKQEIQVNSTQLISRKTGKSLELPSYAFLVELSRKNQSLKILLEDSCRDTYLPQRIYGYGPFSEYDWRWDNFKRHIFVDRFLVTNRDINEWLDYAKIKDLEKERDPDKIPLAATHLKIPQMKKFCQFRGKELLQAHIFDAASFHPGDYERVKPKRSFRGPYPWSQKKKNSYLYQASVEENFSFDKKYCLKVFSKECREDFLFDAYAPLASSWTGLLTSLGGPLEVFRNSIEPKNNLKVSSFYYDVYSLWHQLGIRTNWDGEGHIDANFKWRNAPPERGEEPYQVGFRCMKRRASYDQN